MIDLILAIILDFILGDPYSFPHPVNLMGNIINLEDRLARRIFKSKRGLKLAGLIIVVVNMIMGFFIPLFLLKSLYGYKRIYHFINIYLIYSCIAARSLHYEAKKVKEALAISIEEGRKRVAYIVGRDTSFLDKEGIIKATVETVAENTSDGVIAPLLYIFFLGAPGGFIYKFINTMDSMLGYMNDKYIDLGYFPAKIDDIFNYIPARITGLLMCLSSIGKFDYKNGFRILKRDKRNHKSPNAGYPESATAGLLGIELGGSNVYHGILIEKPGIGDGINLISLEDIDRSIIIMYRSQILLVLFYLISLVII